MFSDKQIPNDKGIDSSIALMQDGYLFIKNRVDRYHSNLFQTRLLMQKVICMSGKEAAEVFYDTERFQRYNATPKRVNIIWCKCHTVHGWRRSYSQKAFFHVIDEATTAKAVVGVDNGAVASINQQIGKHEKSCAF